MYLIQLIVIHLNEFSYLLILEIKLKEQYNKRKYIIIPINETRETIKLLEITASDTQFDIE
jgi:hypothetical protein